LAEAGFGSDLFPGAVAVISTTLADVILLVSLGISLWAYVSVSRREGSYLNILTPAYAVSIPASYLFPLFYTHVFGNDATPYAYTYVYLTMAFESLTFVYFYLRPTKTLLRLPFRYSYENFFGIAMACLALAFLVYAPVLIEFRQDLLDPRQIYRETRTGLGLYSYTSSALAYLAIILVLFSRRSRRVQTLVVLAATLIISLHGSKGLLLNVLFLLLLYAVYVAGRKIGFLGASVAGLGIGVLALGLFAATMVLGSSPFEAIQSISQYSDYTRNGMMVIDSKMPLQYGRLAYEANVIGRIPRALMPNKPKNFGYMYLDEIFYPEWLDEDVGAPSFGVGVPYADFGVFAVVYLAFFAGLRGWLARIFVNRVRLTRHPADFYLLAFFADISLFSVGGVGWLLPEAIVVAALLCMTSCFGAEKVYRERIVSRPRLATSQPNRTNS
jgi:hypothetical protein